MPDEPEVAGLLALLLLTESRRASRTRADGSLVLLAEQDRTRWDRAPSRRARRSSAGACAATNPARTSCRPPSTPCTRTPRRADGDRLVADRRPVRPAARGGAHAGRGAQSRHRDRRGARPRGRAGAGRRVGPGQLLPVPRHARRSASAARSTREAPHAYARAAALAPTDAERDFLSLGGRGQRP